MSRLFGVRCVLIVAARVCRQVIAVLCRSRRTPRRRRPAASELAPISKDRLLGRQHPVTASCAQCAGPRTDSSVGGSRRRR